MSSPGAPPPVLRTAVSAPAESPAPRHLEGWICVIALILLLYAASLVPDKHAKPKVQDVSEAQWQLKLEVFRYRLGHSDTGSPVVGTAMGDLTAQRATNPIAAEFYAAEQRLHGRKLKPADLDPMRKSDNSVDRSVANLFGTAPVDPATVAQLSRGLDQRGFLGELIEAEAYDSAGNPRPIKELEDHTATTLFAFFSLAGLVVVASPILWLIVLGKRESGVLRPLGFPSALSSLADADRYAMRGAQILTLFLGLQIVAFLIAGAFVDKETATQFSLGILMLVGVPILFRTVLYRKTISLASIGVQPRQLGQMVSIGLLGFVLEFPAAMALAALGSFLFGRFHQASHPVTTQLLGTHTSAYVWSALFFASIAAPFWEEILFRGLLFPVLSKVFKSAVLGAAVSSFIFGAIHPQGLPLWLTLMGMAGMSCALTYHTKSLVPSMVMHALHNGMALLFILALT